METKGLSESAVKIIHDYSNFSFGNATCSVPYFNNKRTLRRAALKVDVGKGSPDEILDEVKQKVILNKINKDDFTNESLKKFLVENNLGLDCSGFAYYVLNEESKNKNGKELKDILKLSEKTGLLGILRAKLRVIENAGVKTFASDENSKVVSIKEIIPGDILTMQGGEEVMMRDHILVFDRVDFENGLPKRIHYVHYIAWPSDGEFGHGFHEGIIEVTDINKNILEQSWSELGQKGEENYTFTKAKKSVTEVRRLKCLS